VRVLAWPHGCAKSRTGLTATRVSATRFYA
jgi:hypothetical protein